MELQEPDSAGLADTPAEDSLRIVSWNVNSLTVRLPRLLDLLAEHRPDVVCLQETKVRSDSVPHLELQLAGYAAVEHSSGGRNGVAVLVREDRSIGGVSAGLPGEPRPDEARWLEVEVEGVQVVSVYVPNGRSLEDPVFEEKLQFLDAMVERAAGLATRPLIVAGDFNIAPSDADVHDPVHYIGTTHTSIRERDAVHRLAALGLRDVDRHLHPGITRFTWWDYRGGNFHKNLGMRIDLVMASDSLVGPSSTYAVLRDYRKGPKPSDHAPMMVGVTTM